MTNPAGKSNGEAFRLDFDRRLTLQFRGSVVTSDASGMPCSARCGRRCSGGLRDTKMSTTPSDCAMIPRCDGSSTGRRLMVVQPRRVKWAASKRDGSRPKGIFSAVADLSGQWIDKVHGRRPPRGVVLDMDSSVSPTYGEQELSVWNGHYECTCYHPLFVTSSAIWSAAPYVPATCTAPMDGRAC